MNICILGWYGTETIGDRAILAGIISLLKHSWNDISIKLGSLYPFYTNRMLTEDSYLYKVLNGDYIDFKLFNSRKINELRDNIKKSDIVLIGGGPLMNLDDLFMLRYAFEYAKKNKKNRYIYGCGIGPLFAKEYKKCVLEIVELANGVILRDSISKEILINLGMIYNKKINKKDILVAFDPAVECAIKYKKYLDYNGYQKNNNIVVNFRAFPSEYSNKPIKNIIDNKLNRIFQIILELESSAVELIPMHYFCIGDDDRKFYAKLKFSINTKKEYYIHYKPLSLMETMNKFYAAKLCVGTRFHSIVLQTMLNGNNLILDYTEPQKGKTTGFLKDLGVNIFGNEHYISLQNLSDISLNFNTFSNIKNNKIIEDYYLKGFKTYKNFNKKIIDGEAYENITFEY